MTREAEINYRISIYSSAKTPKRFGLVRSEEDAEPWMELLMMAYMDGFKAGHHFEKDPSPPRFLRVQRKVRHRGWQFLHYFLARPLLCLNKAWGSKLHAYTSQRMHGDTVHEYLIQEDGEVIG